MDEYEKVLRIWELRSRHIMTWGQILLPLSAAIVAFFVTQAHNIFGIWDFSLLLIGWFVFLSVILYWRWVVHYIDRAIVNLYPTMLRLEKERGWQTQTVYYFNNLNWLSISFLAGRLRNVFTTYEDFQRLVKRRKLDSYNLLLEVWGEFQERSVTDRGHRRQDELAWAAVIVFLVAVLFIWVWWWALTALILYSLIIPWGRHYGYYFIGP